MHIFWDVFGGDAPLLWRLLSLCQVAFVIWMVVDAYHRHADPFWYWVILLFQPIGVDQPRRVVIDAEEDALVSFMQTLTDGFMSRDQR